MANPNPEIWGNSETWEFSKNAYGLETETAISTNAYKPKCNNFGTIILPDYEQTLYSGVLHGQIEYNSPLDRSICPCGQAPDVSPFAHIAVFNENNDLSISPSSIHILSEYNVNWFFCDRKGSNNSEYFSRTYNYNDDSGLAYEQFSPKGATVNPQKNPNLRIAPYTQYGIKSLVLGIQVHCVLKTATQSITGTFWATLDDWKNNYSNTYNICGLRLFVRNCTNIAGETLTYNNDSTITAGQCAGEIGVITDINVMNNGENTNTEFLTLFQETGLSERCSYIFDRTNTVFNWNDERDNRVVLSCWDYFDGQEIKQTKPIEADPVCYYWYSIPYSENNYNKIMSIAALFGCYFTPTGKYSFADTMTDTDLCLTVLDDNGVAHGEYTRGLDNANNSLYDKSSIRDIDYNPDVPPAPVDPNTYSNITGFNSITAGASATERYVLDAGNTRQLLSDLWTISHDIAGVDYDNYDYKILDSFLVSNPIDCIISLKRFPFNIPHTFSSAKTSVNLGKNHGSAEGYLTYNVFNTVQFAGINIFPRFGNSFLDYAPYTEYELYVPFCGTVKLNAGDILGHTLNCRLQIDLITGACTAYIMTDSLVIETMTGTVSCELALTGIDSATIDANIQNSVLNHVNARTNKETSMLSPLSVGGLVSAVSNPFKTAGNITTAKTELQRAEYELTHIQTQPHTMGTAGGLTGWYQEFNARLMIYYPEGDVITSSQPPTLKNLKSYGHTTGFAIIDNAALSNYSGFTVATNAILNFAATTTEKEMIESALNGGIFI
jgi:hypothetical protein